VVNVEEFIERGWVRVRHVIPEEVVRDVREAVRHLVPDEPAEPWKLGMASVYDLPVLAHAVSPRMRAAVDQLVGTGRWHFAARWGFPTRFAGPIEPCWHIDGDWFTHHLTSGDQVLTPIVFWDTVGPDDGPTLLWPGSHRAVARLLASREPAGIPGGEIAGAVQRHLSRDVPDPVPGIADAGDVILCHPFLAHTINPCGAARARYISNVAVHASSELNLDETRRQLSPVETAISQALVTGD
jgi:hypothetical protein